MKVLDNFIFFSEVTAAGESNVCGKCLVSNYRNNAFY